MLDQLEAYRQLDGRFVFKLVWPELSDPGYQIWAQTSNPVTAGSLTAADGYEALDVSYTSSWGNGLRYDNDQSGSTLLHASTPGSWWYSVGAKVAHLGGIPGPLDAVVQQTELYVFLELSPPSPPGAPPAPPAPSPSPLDPSLSV